MKNLDINNYKAVAFDLFHTLISLVHINTPGKNTNEILNIKNDIWIDALFNKSEDRLRGKITDFYEIMRDIVDKIDPYITDPLIKAAAESRAWRFEYSIQNALSSTIETLKQLKDMGKKIGLISNADKLEKNGWDGSKISKYFDEAVFSCDIGYMKPEKEIYFTFLNRMQIDPEDCIFVGDGSCNELTGAKVVGMTTVFTSEFIKDLWPEKINERIDLADYHISSLNQLLG